MNPTPVKMTESDNVLTRELSILTVANATPNYINVCVASVEQLQKIPSKSREEGSSNSFGNDIDNSKDSSSLVGQQTIPPASKGQFFSYIKGVLYITVSEFRCKLNGYVTIAQNTQWTSDGNIIVANRRLIDAVSKDNCWVDTKGQSWIVEKLPWWLKIEDEDILHTVLEHVKFEKNLKFKRRLRSILQNSPVVEELQNHPTLKWTLSEALDNLRRISEEYNIIEGKIKDIESQINNEILELRCQKGRTERWIKAHSVHYENKTQQEKQELLLQSAKSGFIENAMALLEVGAYINCVDTKGFTPLHWACLCGHDDLVQILLASSAEVNCRTLYELTDEVTGMVIISGSTPLHLASATGNHSIASLLLRNFCEVDIRDKFDRTALHLASLHGHATTVELLLKDGKVSTDIKDLNFGSTPLHLSCWKGHIDVTELLLKAGAKVNELDFCKWSPLRWAISNSFTDIEKMLLRFGAAV